MRLALCGWATNSGVGTEFLDALRNLPVASAFVLRNEAKPTRHDRLSKVPHVISSGKGLEREMERFIESHRPETILTWETPGSWEFPAIWKKKGIRWISVAHWDWFDGSRTSAWKTCSIVSPNALCWRRLAEMGLSSTYLPVPIDTDRFVFRQRTRADLFVSIYGYGGQDDRRGFPEILSAWADLAGVGSRLLVRAQKVPPEIPSAGVPRVEVRVENLADPAELFSEGDVAVQPSRYEGVGVTLLEAQACGLPTIAADAEPMREIAPDLLVPVGRVDKVRILGKDVESHVVSTMAFHSLLSRLSGSDITALSLRARARVEEGWSWRALRPRWYELLGCAGG
jgi:glycosyltransferase involved in cell wall biosynthesis